MARSTRSTLEELLPFEINSSDIKGLEDEERRGSGSFGAVFAVTVRGTSRIAKRLHSIMVGADVNQSERQGIKDRFLNECLLLSKLDHPNVVKFVGVHFSPQDRSDVTLIMEQLHMDLEKFLDPEQRPDIDIETKLSILLDVSSGLLYLHTQLAKPIIHRDLTSGNVLLTKEFKQAKIADLGVSKLVDGHLHRAATRTACPGTLAYMPPEALRDNPEYDTSLDIFSFGQLTLYVVLQQFPQVALELPSEQVIRAHQLGKAAILKRKKWLDKLPDDHCLSGLILSCLRDHPSERPSTKSLNVKMKMLCRLELDGELYGSYTAVHKVIARGAPRIAKRLNSILESDDISLSERQCIRERFHSECLALSKLDHPNILKFIRVHFNPEDRSDMAIIFEQLHTSLEEFLNPKEFPDIHLNTKLSILYDVSCGLLYLHTQLETPFIHGELTAANVLLTEDLKQAKIADLGVLKLVDGNLHQTVTCTMCPDSCLAYMPPEVLRDDPEYDTSLDIFSFGKLSLYVVLRQFPQVAFELPSEQVIRARDLGKATIPKQKKWLDKLPDDHCLHGLILSCLRDHPSERPSTESLNVKMKVLCGLELKEFEIKDVKGISNGEMYSSHTTVCKVIARGAPRIAKRLNNILDSELHKDVSPTKRQQIREKFHSHCLALSKLDHPNILKFIGVHFIPEDRSDMAIIFECLHMSLEKFLNLEEFHADIHMNTKVSILHDVSCGLLYLHSQPETPFIHGELTAANVLLTEDLKQAKIADLGILKFVNNNVHQQHKSCQILAYLPPEIFSKNLKHAYDTSVDIFSFGHLALYVVLQEFPEVSHEVLLTVTCKKGEMEILKRKRWIDQLAQDHCLRDVIMQCLKDEPEKRPTTAEVNNIMSVLHGPDRKAKVCILSGCMLFRLCCIPSHSDLSVE